MAATAAFLEPLTSTVPWSFCPPSMIKRSLAMSVVPSLEEGREA
jgi:hypothetical protein